MPAGHSYRSVVRSPSLRFFLPWFGFVCVVTADGALSGSDVSILELTRLVMEVLDYDGEIVTDPSKPDGTPRKLMDNTRLRSLGWAPRVGLTEGIKRSYAAFLAGEGRNL